MADLQGPKIRIGKLANGKVTLGRGEVHPRLPTASSATRSASGSITRNCLAMSLPEQCSVLDDGLIRLRVESVLGNQIVTRVEVGGVLSNNKGINRQGGGLTAPALTDQGHG